MVQPASAQFIAKEALPHKTPVYAVIIDAGTTAPCFVNTLSGSFITTYNAGPIYSQVNDISAQARTITPELGTSTVGAMSITLNDNNNAVTAILDHLTKFKNGAPRTVKVLAGYAGMNFGDMTTTGDALQIYTGVISGDVKMTDDFGAWVIPLSDMTSLFFRDIFRFRTSDPLAADPLMRPLILQGNPFDIALQIMTSTGTAGANGPYDVLSAADGMGIPKEFIDIASIETERDTWWAGYQFYWQIEKKENAKGWMEKEIYQAVGAYPIIRGDGKISIKVERPYTPAGSVPTLNPDNIIKISNYSRGQKGVINNVTFKYDWDPASQAYMTETTIYDANSALSYDITRNLIIESKGIRGSRSFSVLGLPDLGGDILIMDRKTRIFQRYGTNVPTMDIVCHMTQQRLEEGDVFFLTHPLIPSETGGTRGLVDEPMQVVSRTPNYKNGTMTFSTIDYAPKSDAVFRLYGPDTLLNWSFESTANRNTYAFFGRWDGTMIDGSPGYNFG